MSWCDKLASTPSAGFKLDQHFASGDVILHALAPVLDKWVEGDKQLFTVDRNEPFSVAFNTDDGYHYGIDSLKTHVTFIHKMKVKPVSGGPPIMEMLSRPLPFTELLPEVSKRLTEVTLLIPSTKDRTLTRVGIIASTTVAEDEAPPGIARFIRYIGRPWEGSVDSFSCQIIAEIDKASSWSDRCIHALNKPEDPEELLTLKFDWQRTFTSGRPITSVSLKEVLASAQKASNDYFEGLAEGSRFDEDLIRSGT